MKIYTVYEIYDVDGGFGDAISQTRDICTFTNKEDAYAFKEKYDKPFAYYRGYNNLWCGTIRVKEIEIRDSFDANMQYKPSCNGGCYKCDMLKTCEDRMEMKCPKCNKVLTCEDFTTTYDEDEEDIICHILCSNCGYDESE